MLRAHHGDDAARYRNASPASVETTARRTLCGPPGSAQQQERYPGVKASARSPAPKVAPEPSEEPDDVPAPSEIVEFSAHPSAVSEGRASWPVSLSESVSDFLVRQSSGSGLPRLPLCVLSTSRSQLDRLLPWVSSERWGDPFPSGPLPLGVICVMSAA